MRIHFLRQWLSIKESVSDEELPELLIVSGLNGSGKSQLVDAIQSDALRVDQPPEGRTPRIAVFKLGQFLAGEAQAQAQALSAHRDPAAQIKQLIDSVVSQQQSVASPESAQVTGQIYQQLKNSNVADSILQKLMEGPKAPGVMRADEISRIVGLLPFTLDPFNLSVSQVFGTYKARNYDNSIRRFRKDVEGYNETFLTPGEFVTMYGPPPWKTLNRILHDIRLPYSFEEPQIESFDTPYEPLLFDDVDRTPVSVGRLSTGERTLLAVALNLYAGSSSAQFAMPDVLLLDEADASLHPSMVSSLLSVLATTFVAENNVKVILTTHSPTTVALSPEESLYAMRRRESPRLAKITREDAISSLSIGIPTLSTKLENRRLVFTEAPVDAKCYELMLNCLEDRLSSPFTLQFTPSSTTEKSGSSSVVADLVQKIRAAGNTQVYGVVDRDQRQGAAPGLKFIEERYTLENLALDPLLMGAFLIRQRIVRPTDVGVSTYILTDLAEPAKAQAIVDAVARKLALDKTARRPIQYVGGQSLEVPTYFLDIKGHDLQERYLAEYPGLKQYANSLPLQLIDRVCREHSGLLPVKALELMESLLVEGDPSLSQVV